MIMPSVSRPIYTQVHTTMIRQTGGLVPPESQRKKRQPLREALSKRLAARAKTPKKKPAPRPVSATTVSYASRPVTRDYTTIMVTKPVATPITPNVKVKNQKRGNAFTRTAARVRSKVTDENFKPLTFGERMLRNTAVCVAVLLCAIAIKSIDAPIAQSVSGEIREWVTMDLDESLGSLKFVQNLIPDAALVFWHIGSTGSFETPTAMAISHSWNETEPYLTFGDTEQAQVYASASGEVMSVTRSDDNTSTIRIRHNDGLETIYGNLASTTVAEGDNVIARQTIGAASELFFEIRGEGRSMNPAPLMAKQ